MGQGRLPDFGKIPNRRGRVPHSSCRFWPFRVRWSKSILVHQLCRRSPLHPPPLSHKGRGEECLNSRDEYSRTPRDRSAEVDP